MASTRIDYLRLNGASRENIEEFFDRLVTQRIASIPMKHSYNMDEIGAQIGLRDSPFVIGPSALKEVFAIDTGKGEWVSSLEAVSADGKVLPPLVIFKGKSVQQQGFIRLTQHQLEELKDWSFAASEAGWTSNSLALKWLKEVFLPLTKPEDPLQWRHLILDGHTSHCSDEFMLACFEAKVWLNFLPAHTSQVLQPLDLGPFSVLKRAYRRLLRQACAESLTMTPKKPEFLKSWSAARKEAFTPANIAAGWKATGIYPRDRSKALNSRLARQRDQDQPEGLTWRVPQPRIDPLLSEMSAIDVQTPSSSRQVHQIQQRLSVVDDIYDSATLRQVFRKTGKALDTAIAENTILKRERDQLAAAIEAQKPQKRRKVFPTAQERFVRLLDVRQQEQLKTEGVAGPSDTAGLDSVAITSSDEEGNSSAEECIEIS